MTRVVEEEELCGMGTTMGHSMVRKLMLTTSPFSVLTRTTHGPSIEVSAREARDKHIFKVCISAT